MIWTSQGIHSKREDNLLHCTPLVTKKGAQKLVGPPWIF